MPQDNSQKLIFGKCVSSVGDSYPLFPECCMFEMNQWQLVNFRFPVFNECRVCMSLYVPEFLPPHKRGRMDNIQVQVITWLSYSMDSCLVHLIFLVKRQ